MAKGVGEGLEAFLKVLSFDPKEAVKSVLLDCGERVPSKNVLCRFYITKCTADGFREDVLMDLMLGWVVVYVTKKEERDKAKAQDWFKLVRTAREMFTQAPTSGEGGELLLFLLLEANGIIQLYSKMDLKTNPNLNFNGCDAIHIRVGKEISLCFGHAKMHADLTGALSSALEDVRQIHQNKIQRRLEFRLVNSNLDGSKFGPYEAKIRSMLDPYSEDRSTYKEFDAIFLGTNWEFAKSTAMKGDSGLEQFMVRQYSSEIDKVAAKIGTAVLSSEEPNVEHLIFLLPFVDVNRFRLEFMEAVTP